ncbi:MAG TPA: PAS domain S-box protein [Kiritimatiellia bacterium]|nr:PAS domain S-box protein [Kiritimatiellia bacterium]
MSLLQDPAQAEHGAGVPPAIPKYCKRLDRTEPCRRADGRRCRWGAAGVLLASACLAVAEASDIQKPEHDAGLRRVTLMMAQRDSYRYVGYHIAREQGFYRDAGLDVRFLETPDGRSGILEVLDEQADFGICDERLIARYLQGSPVVVLAAWIQRAPHYGELLFTTRDTIKRAPECVLAFREASLRGWEHANDHIEEAVDLYCRRIVPSADRDTVLREAETRRELMAPAFLEMGYIDRRRWRERVRDIAESIGIDVTRMPAGYADRLLADHYLAHRLRRRRWLITMVAAGAAVLICVGGLAVWWLKRTLRRRTAELTAAHVRLRQEGERRRIVAKELAQAESLAKALSDGVADGVALTDVGRRYLYVNPQMAALYGYTEQELVGQTFDLLLTPAEAQRQGRFFDKRVQGDRRDLHRYEATLRAKNGDLRPVEISVNEVAVRGERAFVSVHRDLSESKRMARDTVRIVEWERRRIGQDLHDTIGQDLTGLAYLLEALQAGGAPLSPEQAECIDNALALCRRAHHRLRGFVAGLLPLGPDEPLADGLRRLATNSFERLGVSCEVSVAGQAKDIELSCAGHLFQMVQEAVENAARHGRASQVRITLAYDGVCGQLQVDDNGTFSGGEGPEIAIMRCRADILRGRLSVRRKNNGGASLLCAFNS